MWWHLLEAPLGQAHPVTVQGTRAREPGRVVHKPEPRADSGHGGARLATVDKQCPLVVCVPRAVDPIARHLGVSGEGRHVGVGGRKQGDDNRMEEKGAR